MAAGSKMGPCPDPFHETRGRRQRLRLVTAGKRAMPEAAGIFGTWCAWPYFDDDSFEEGQREPVGSMEDGAGRSCRGFLGTVPKGSLFLNPGFPHKDAHVGLWHSGGSCCRC